MKVIDRYNTALLQSKRSSERHYHMPSGRTFRNLFLNLQAGGTYGPFSSDDELVILCHAGEFTVGAVDEEKLVIWTLELNGNTRGEGETKLIERDQLVVSAQCHLKISCLQPGTIQIIGTPNVSAIGKPIPA